MDIINEYLKKNYKCSNPTWGMELPDLTPWIQCKDGFTISVQASYYHYCVPRQNKAWPYDEVELGYPSENDELIIDYAEDPEYPTKTVYGFVPINIVNELIEKHGGITNF